MEGVEGSDGLKNPLLLILVLLFQKLTSVFLSQVIKQNNIRLNEKRVTSLKELQAAVSACTAVAMVTFSRPQICGRNQTTSHQSSPK